MEGPLSKWVVWAVILVAQNASSTWGSRARNSASVPYHALASVFSNGVWFVSNLFLVDSALSAARSGSVSKAAALGIFYTTFTVIGAVIMHWVSINYLERGRRRVGSLDE